MTAKKLTITVSEEVYRGLHKKIGPGNISRFIDRLARPYVVNDALEAAYREMAEEEARAPQDRPTKGARISVRGTSE